MTTIPEWMNIDTWLEHTGRQFCRDHVKRGCAKKQIRCVKFGRVWLVHRDALSALEG